MSSSNIVSVIMGSQSDWHIMAQSVEVLKDFGVVYEQKVLSAHRTPAKMLAYAQGAYAAGIRIIIAGAGGAAHLPGMVAAATTVPVIGVPILSKNSLQGIDSLLSIVQMPAGVPVATVGVGGAYNAGLLAVRMLSIHDTSLTEALLSYQKSLQDKVKAQNQALESDQA